MVQKYFSAKLVLWLNKWMKFKKCESGSAKVVLREIGSAKLVLYKIGTAKVVLCEKGSVGRLMNEISKVRIWFYAKLVLLETGSAKRVLRGTGSAQAVPYEIGSMTRQIHAFFISNTRFWFRLNVAYYSKETSQTCCLVVAYYFLMLSFILPKKLEFLEKNNFVRYPSLGCCLTVA